MGTVSEICSRVVIILVDGKLHTVSASSEDMQYATDQLPIVRPTVCFCFAFLVLFFNFGCLICPNVLRSMRQDRFGPVAFFG